MMIMKLLREFRLYPKARSETAGRSTPKTTEGAGKVGWKEAVLPQQGRRGLGGPSPGVAPKDHAGQSDKRPEARPKPGLKYRCTQVGLIGWCRTRRAVTGVAR